MAIVTLDIQADIDSTASPYSKYLKKGDKMRGYITYDSCTRVPLKKIDVNGRLSVNAEYSVTTPYEIRMWAVTKQKSFHYDIIFQSDMNKPHGGINMATYINQP